MLNKFVTEHEFKAFKIGLADELKKHLSPNNPNTISWSDFSSILLALINKLES